MVNAQSTVDLKFPSNTRYTPITARLGGMGVVFFCHDTLAHSDVVLKTFKPDILNHRTDRLRFLQEMCDWVFLGQHPNIVQAFRIEQLGYPAQPYLVLEAIAGRNLGDDVSLSTALALLPNRQLPIKTGLSIALQVVRAMLHAEQRIKGFVHRDIKPENVLIDPQGVARLTDFGVAHTHKAGSEKDWLAQLDEVKVKSYRPAGSPFYIAPEQWSPTGMNADCRVDIYALGHSLYEILVGVKRISGSTLDEVIEAHINADLLKTPKDMPEPIRVIIETCMAYEPGHRYQSWVELECALEECFENLFGQGFAQPKAAVGEQSDADQNAQSYFAVAQSYLAMGVPETALEYNQLAFDGNVQPVLRIELLLQAGEIHELRNQNSDALTVIEHALELAEQGGDKKLITSCLTLYGGVLAKDKQYQLSVKYLEQALKLAQSNQLSEICPLIQGNLANTLALSGDLERAVSTYSQQLENLAAGHDVINLTKCRANLAIAHFDLGEFAKAIDGLTLSLVEAKEQGDAFGQSHALKHLYLSNQKMGRAEDAEKWLSEYLIMVSEWQDQAEIQWAKEQQIR